MSAVIYQSISEALTREVVRSDRAFDRLEVEWRALHGRAVSASASLSWDWMRGWWRTFGRGDNSALTVITFRRDGILRGILPLYVEQGKFGLRNLRFISTAAAREETVYPENLSILAAPDDEEECTAAAADFLFGPFRDEWDVLDFGVLRPGSHLAAMEVPPRGFHRFHEEIPCFRASLSEGDDYLPKLRGAGGQQLRRILRQSERQGVAFTVAGSSEEGISYLHDLIALHSRRWKNRGDAGAFASARKIQFHAELIERLVPRGEALLFRLSLEGSTAAIIYGFLSHGRFEFYQSGVDVESSGLKSPGILCHLLCMRHLSGAGVRLYDFLPGADSYKERLSTSVAAAPMMSVSQSNVRTNAARTAELISRAPRKIPHIMIRLIQRLRPAA